MMLRSIAAGFLAFVVLLGEAPLAHADEDMFLQQMRQKNKLFMDVTNGQLLKLGYVACQTMRESINNGMSMGNARHEADQAVGSVASRLGLKPDLGSVMHITQDAEDYLC